MNIVEILAGEFDRSPEGMEKILALFDEGNTIPFIARYRKEITGNMEDETLRSLSERREFLTNFFDRRETILNTIREQGNLTEEIKAQLSSAETMAELEDIYRPFKPKKRTRATMAREKGLGPYAEMFLSEGSMEEFERALANAEDLTEELTAEERRQGVMDIVAEVMQDDPTIRNVLKKFLRRNALYYTEEKEDSDQNFLMYYDTKTKYSRIPDHQVLAIDRGEATDALKVSLLASEETLISLMLQTMKFKEDKLNLATEIAKDSLKRLIYPSLERELRRDRSEIAQKNAIEVFGKNLRPLLLTPPLFGKRILAIDPGIRTGCKVAILNEYGDFLDNTVVYLTGSDNQIKAGKEILGKLVQKYTVDVIAIGSGTASYESELAVSELIEEQGLDIEYAIVNEDGASVYSASPLAKKEFPDLDVTVRGAISIGRRLQDPLAELVKIEPRHIGVGQYQHDLNQKELDVKLDGVVESCVNYVGVNINSASVPLLSHVAGITNVTAKNIVAYRQENGPFTSRKQIKEVKGIGPKAFEQSAGFLRIPESDELLDNTAVHPESYDIARILMDESLSDAERDSALAQTGVGEMTLRDIQEELKKPGRDVRTDVQQNSLRRTALKMEDLKEGMVLPGVVRNIVDFGAFVDIGIKKAGLLHKNEIVEKRNQDIYEFLKVGDTLDVQISKLDLDRERISLKWVR